MKAARSLIQTQNFEPALETISRCTAKDPAHVDALVLKGNIQYLLARDDDAIATLKQAIAVDPKRHDARYAIGRIHYANARYDDSAAEFEAIVAAEPSHYRAWDNLGLAREGQGRIDDAIAAHTKSIALTVEQLQPYDWAYANLADLLMKQDQNRRAFDLAVQAAELNPNGARNFYLAAKALSRLEQWPKCERWLKRSAELDPAYPEPHYLLGRLYQREGKTEEAARELELFKKLRDQEPGKRR